MKGHSAGKFYIGVSIDPEKRWNNGYGYMGNLQFFHDIKEVGWNNFYKQILWKTNSKYDIAVMESFLIDQTNSSHFNVGYNQGMFYFTPEKSGSQGIMYGGIPASAYNESRAWDIISDLPKYSNLSLFLREQGIIPDSWWDMNYYEE